MLMIFYTIDFIMCASVLIKYIFYRESRYIIVDIKVDPSVLLSKLYIKSLEIMILV